MSIKFTVCTLLGWIALGCSSVDAPAESSQHMAMDACVQVSAFGKEVGDQNYAVAVNNSGAVLGYGFVNELGRERLVSFVRDGAGIATFNGWATDINEDGDVAVNAGYDYASLAPAVWRRGVIQELGTGAQSWAADINDRGDVVGSLLANDGTERAYLWRNGTITEIGPLPGYARSFGLRVNNAGQVLGFSRTLDNTRERPFIWQDGTLTELTGFEPQTLNVQATAMNELGAITVRTKVKVPDPENRCPEGEERGFVWQNGVLTPLGPHTVPLSINDSHQVAGYIEGYQVRQNAAFSWDSGALTRVALPEHTGARNVQINERGDLAIYTFHVDLLVWSAGRLLTLTDLERYNDYAELFAMNDNGLVVGTSSGDVTTGWYATAWDISACAR